MPRRSLKARVRAKLLQMAQQRQRNRFVRNILMEDDFNVNDGDDIYNDINEIVDMQVQEALQHIDMNRYLFRPNKYRNRTKFFDWNDCFSDNSVRFNEEEFLKHFRLSRKNFWHLVDLLKDDDAFRSMEGKRPKASVARHVIVYLYRLGREGADGSAISIATFFGLGKGTVSVYIARVVKAIKAFKNDVVHWPDAQEKENIKSRIRVKHGFQNCIGIIDGTLIGLATKPSVFGESYFCRKHIYAINVQIICDDRGRIRYYYGGWPGSTHDNRAWRNSKVFLDVESYFQDGEYLLGDSAYSCSSVMVPTFKSLPGQKLSSYHEFFNNKAAAIRVVSEHCNGILKNRFTCLKNINIDANGSKGVKEIMEIFETCCVLHNIFIDYDDDVPQEWIDNIDSNHYWTSDEDESNIQNGSIDQFNRREAVFNAFINDYYNEY
jgi:hypothetical protein